MKKPHLAVLFLIVAVYLFSGYLINSKRILPLENDEAVHLTHSFYYYDIFKNPFPHTFNRLLDVDDRWPPFFHFICGLFCFIFGKSYNSFLFVHTAYLFLALFSIYFIVKKINSEESAILSILVFAAYPLTFMLYNWFVLEFSLASLVLFGFCCLVYSENFQNLKFSLLLGFVFGIGMLTKWTYLFFIAGPFLYFFLRGLNNKRNTVICNALLVLLIAFYLGHFWVFRHFNNLIKVIPEGLIRTSESIPKLSLSGVLFYMRSFYYGVSWVGLSVVFVSLIYFVVSSNKNKLLFILTVIFPYFILTLIDNKWGHYIFPVFPIFAMISGIAITDMLKKTDAVFRMGIYVLIAAAFFLNTIFIPVFYPISPGIRLYIKDCSIMPKKNNQDTPMPRSSGGHAFYLGNLYRDYFNVASLGRMKYVSLHNRDNLNNALQYMVNNTEHSLSVGVVDLVTPSILFNLRYLSVLNDIDANFYSLPYSVNDFMKNMDIFDFILVNIRDPEGNKDSLRGIFKAEKLDKINNLSDTEISRIEEDLGKVLHRFDLVKSYKIYNSNPMLDSFLLLLKSKRSVTPLDGGQSYGYYLNYFSKSLGKISEGFDLKNNVLNLAFRGNEIMAVFNSWGTLFSSKDFIWDFKKVSEERAIALGYSRFFPFYQSWEFEINGQEVFLRISMFVDGFISNVHSFNLNTGHFSIEDTVKNRFKDHLFGFIGPGEHKLFDGYLISPDKAAEDKRY